MYKNLFLKLLNKLTQRNFCDVRAMYLQTHQRSAKYVGAVTRKVCH